MHRNTTLGKVFLLTFLLLMVLPSFGQRRKPVSKKKSKEPTETFAQKLWYGGSVGLGFSGTGNFSYFNFGLSPMVGYKITPSFSVGPRVGFDYTYVKGEAIDAATGSFVGKKSAQPVSLEMGLFTRFKILDFLFAHAEYSKVRDQFFSVTGNGFNDYILYDSEKRKALITTEWNDNLLLGAGYTSGGDLAYEILLLYNFLEPDNSNQVPFRIRFGFTYRF